MNKQPDINPQTKIGEMLEAYPQLEDVLLSLSPSFAKLKNPLLRKTIGRVASLRQAADIGGVRIGDMISVLRKAAGMDDEYFADGGSGSEEISRPEWAAESNISITLDVCPTIENGGNPMQNILGKAGQIEGDEVMLLISPFKPVPIIELLTSKGYLCWCDESSGNKVYTYIRN